MEGRMGWMDTPISAAGVEGKGDAAVLIDALLKEL